MAGGMRDLFAWAMGWRSSGEDADAVVPDQPGREFTLPTNRPHFALPTNRPHFTLPKDDV